MTITGRGLAASGDRHALEVAMGRLGITTIAKLLDALERRARSERELVYDGPLRSMRAILEPPSCQMDRCTHHGVAGFAMCRLDRAPSRCKEHRAFLARREERTCLTCKGTGKLGPHKLSCKGCQGTGRRRKDTRPYHYRLACEADDWNARQFATVAKARLACRWSKYDPEGCPQRRKTRCPVRRRLGEVKPVEGNTG